ncbi:MAG: PEP-CTERM sorting domain-containing protein [Luteolibacter sp.]
MKTTRKITILAATLIAFGSFAARGHAAIVMIVAPSGDDVVLSFSGSLNISGLTKVDILTGGNVGAINGSNNVYYSFSSSVADAYVDSIGSVILQSPTSDTTGVDDIATGDTFGVFLDGDDLFVPDGYISGSQISGSSIFPDTSLAELGITPGVTGFVATLNNGSGDTVSFSAIPEPSSALLFGFGSLAVLCRRNRLLGFKSEVHR